MVAASKVAGKVAGKTAPSDIEIVVANMGEGAMGEGMGAGKGAGKTAPNDTEIINAAAFDLAGIKIVAIAPVRPEAAAVLEPTYIEAGNHPDRKRLADDVRAALGLPIGGDKKAAAAAQEQHRAAQADQQVMQKASAQADIRGRDAKAELDRRTKADEIIAPSHLAAMQHKPMRRWPGTTWCVFRRT